MEWAVFGLSGLLVAGTLVFLAFSALNDDRQPADIRVEISKVIARGNSAVVYVQGRNHGTLTATDVTLAVVASDAGVNKESTVTIDFIPENATREATVVFEGVDPSTKFTPRVVGYIEP